MGLDHDAMVREIKALCHERRLPCYDTQQASWAADSKGWVDLVILGRGAALFVEVKKQDGRLTRDQERASNELATAGLWWRCWRPDDYESRIIHKELDELAAESRRR